LHDEVCWIHGLFGRLGYLDPIKVGFYALIEFGKLVNRVRG